MWWLFQLAAVLAGAIAARRVLKPYVVGLLLAAIGAPLFANGGEWLSWLTHGGPLPELEVSGFGAIAGLVTGYLLVARRTDALNALAPAFGLMLMIARVGCFFAGCDFGAPTSLPWAVRYPHFTPAFRQQLHEGLITLDSAMTVPIHPTQLYESLLGAVLFLVALKLRKKRFAVIVVLYAIGRFAIDFVRGDLAHGALGLTSSQWLAIVVIGIVIQGITHDHSSFRNVRWRAQVCMAKRRA